MRVRTIGSWRARTSALFLGPNTPPELDFMPGPDKRESLADLIRRARAADKHDRIQYRDPIAAYGAEAIEPMLECVADRELGAFTVRVIAAVADPEMARAGLEAARLRAATAAVARDIEEAMNRLRPGGAHSSTRRAHRGGALIHTLPKDDKYLPPLTKGELQLLGRLKQLDEP
jgi:hypothetical protein